MQPEAFWDVGGYCFWPFDARLARYLTVLQHAAAINETWGSFQIGLFWKG